MGSSRSRRKKSRTLRFATGVLAVAIVAGVHHTVVEGVAEDAEEYPEGTLAVVGGSVVIDNAPHSGGTSDEVAALDRPDPVALAEVAFHDFTGNLRLPFDVTNWSDERL